MNKNIIGHWVGQNIYPRVSPGFKYTVWAIVFVVFWGLAGSYDVWFNGLYR